MMIRRGLGMFWLICLGRVGGLEAAVAVVVVVRSVDPVGAACENEEPSIDSDW